MRARNHGGVTKVRALGRDVRSWILQFSRDKNIIAGEGGARWFASRACAAREHHSREGTDRGRFFRGEVDKYVPGKILARYFCRGHNAALLWAQLEEAQPHDLRAESDRQRLPRKCSPRRAAGFASPPDRAADCCTNGHRYYISTLAWDRSPPRLDELKNNGTTRLFYTMSRGIHRGQDLGSDEGMEIFLDDTLRAVVRLPTCG